MRPSFHGSRLGMPAPPARWVSSSRLNGKALPRELIPLAGTPGARVEMHLQDLKISPRSEYTLSVRAVDAAGNRGPEATATIRLSSRAPAKLPPLEQLVTQPSGVAAPPRVAGADVAILDELDKVNPSTGELDSRAARRLSDRESSLGCRGSPDQAPRSSK